MGHVNKGQAFEYIVQAQLEKRGAYVVRSSGSHGVVDLVAFWPADAGTWYESWMVQCKLYVDLSRSEWNELYNLARTRGCVPCLATRKRRQDFVTIARLTGTRDHARAGCETWPWEVLLVMRLPKRVRSKRGAGRGR